MNPEPVFTDIGDSMHERLAPDLRPADRILYLTYLCPDGFEGMEDCSGDDDSIQGIKFCVQKGDTIAMERRCDGGASSAIGTVLVGVTSNEYRGDCDAYGLNIFATYGPEVRF